MQWSTAGRLVHCHDLPRIISLQDAIEYGSQYNTAETNSAIKQEQTMNNMRGPQVSPIKPPRALPPGIPAGFLASKFTTATTKAIIAPIQLASGLSDAEEVRMKTEEAKKILLQHEVEVRTAEEAAQMGMFGIMTRKIENWVPERLLLKRLEIIDPIVHADGRTDRR